MATQTEYLKRPLTPFFLYAEGERKKGNKDAAALGKKWNKMTEAQKKKYIDEYKEAKTKYSKFIEEIYGSDPLTLKPSGKPIEFSIARMRGILGQSSSIKPMAKGLYPGLVKVLVIP